MKAAVIAPTSMLEWLQEEFSPTFHMVLTQVYLSDPNYASFFQERRAAGDALLLDNGAAELKASVEAKEVMKVVEDLKPSIVVAPDVIYDSLGTFARTGGFLAEYRHKLSSLGVQVMAVPQGETNDLYLSCFRMFNSSDHIDWLGISKFYHERFDGRLNLLSLIEKEVQKPCHLLGVWDSLYSLGGEQFGFAKSNDTAKPVKLGLQGLSLEGEERRKKVHDFFSLPIPDSMHLDQIRRNVEEYLYLTKEST